MPFKTDEDEFLIREKLIDYGTLIRSKEIKTTNGLSGLFRYATKTDYFYLIIGTIFALIQGASMPCLGYVFGLMTDVFLNRVDKDQIDEIIEEKYESINRNRSFKSSALESYASETGDKDIQDNFMSDVYFFCAVYILLGLISFFSSFLQIYFWERVADRQLFQLRKKFFTQVLRQNIGFFETEKRGDYVSNLSDDLERIRDGIGYKLSMIVFYVAVFVSGFTLSMALNWKLTCVLLIIAPILILTSAYMAKSLSTGSVREQLKYSEASAVAEEVFTCLKTVVAYGTVDYECSRYHKSLEDGRKSAMKKYYVMSLISLFLYTIMYSSYGFGFWYGSVLISENMGTVGEIFGVLFCLVSAAFSFGNILPYFNAVTLASGSSKTIQEIIDRVPLIDPYSTRGLQLNKFHGHLSFKDVFFRYPSRETTVLNGISFEVQPGQNVAIVGESGSGKSTIINLLLRYYDAIDGNVEFDGINIKDINLKWLRKKIGVVSQEPVLFGVTIAENISYGGEDVTMEDIRNAANLANAHSFIEKLPQGYNTLVGEHGSQLSGGQKQRIAIARAIIRDPTFLVLDEATSALDTESESIVRSALTEAMKGRTTLIIAHRLSTIKNSDMIYVMDKGKILEKGTHHELMALDGHYSRYVAIQTDDQDQLPLESPSINPHMLSPKKISIDDSPVEETNEKTIGMIRGLLQLGKLNLPEWHWLLIGFCACFLFGVIPPLFAYLYSEMISIYEEEGEKFTEGIKTFSSMFAYLGIFCGVTFATKVTSMVTAAECLVARLRYLSFRNIIRQELSWFDLEENSFSVLLTKLSRDAPLVKAAAGLRAGQFISAFVTMAVGITIAVYYGWKMALLLLLVSPFLVYSSYKQVSLVRKSQLQDTDALDKAGKIAGECFRNIKTVQSLAREKLFVGHFVSHLQGPFDDSIKLAASFSTAYAFAQSMNFFVYALSFFFGGYLIINGEMEITDLFKVFFAISFCTAVIGQGVAILQDFTKANIATASIFKLMDRKSLVDPLSDYGIRKTVHGKIEFKNIKFVYPSRPHIYVLYDFNLKVEIGQTIALVGSSGCGKSTVINLIEQFYLPLSGEILVDDLSIEKINVDCLRSQIGIVTQEPLLFNSTIKENIVYGSRACGFIPSDCDIIAAAKLANIHDFIVSLPQGYDTMCGQLGAQLSGGQKQRIAIARAVIRNPKILLLDEATSALDSNSEKVVQEALDRASIGRTTLIVSHRLSTIKNADLIAVLHKGRIVEVGKHYDLLQKVGHYYNLVKNQV